MEINASWTCCMKCGVKIRRELSLAIQLCSACLKELHELPHREFMMESQKLWDRLEVTRKGDLDNGD